MILGHSTAEDGENEELGVEAEVFHQDTSSPPSGDESSAEGDRTTVNNFYQPPHRGGSLSAVIFDSDRWSSEAIVERSKARTMRMERLKMAELLREKPEFDFLLE